MQLLVLYHIIISNFAPETVNMLTPEQIEFFLSFKSFIPNQDANSAQEFARLARTRRWKVGGQTFKKNSKVFELLPAPQPADDDNKEGGKEGGR